MAELQNAWCSSAYGRPIFPLTFKHPSRHLCLDITGIWLSVCLSFKMLSTVAHCNDTVHLRIHVQLLCNTGTSVHWY